MFAPTLTSVRLKLPQALMVQQNVENCTRVIAGASRAANAGFSEAR